MSARTEAVKDAFHQAEIDGPRAGASLDTLTHAALAAADAVMFSDEAVEQAADAMLQHWRHTTSGKCMCGELVDGDPQEVAKHMARAVIAALKQEDQ